MSNSIPNDTCWKESSLFIVDPQNAKEVHVKINPMRKEPQYWELKFDYSYINGSKFNVSVHGIQEREYKCRATYCEFEMMSISSTAIVGQQRILLDTENYNNFQACFNLNCSWGSFIRVSVAFGCDTFAKPQLISYDPMKTMLEKGEMTDFTIKTKNREVTCHKLVLAARSVYFRTMFTTSMKETEENVLNWEDVFDEATVEDLLEYVYLGSKPPSISTTCFRLIQVSDLCLLEELKEMCVAEIISAITKDYVVEVLAMGEKYESNELKEFAMNFIMEQYSELDGDPSKLEGWNELEPRMIKSILMSIIKIIGHKKIRL